tara:strand:- start:911 stop:2614 length:1704 start_codon:yes stop_codon:yes gene_type:complete
MNHHLLQKASIVLSPTAYKTSTLNSIKPAYALGSELILNGNFDTDTSNWFGDSGASLTWQSNKSVLVATTDDATFGIAQSSVLTSGKKYRVSFRFKPNNTTTFRVRLGASGSGQFSTTSFTANEWNDVDFVGVANGTTFEIGTVGGSISNFYLDNVSCKEVTDADFDFTRNTTATRFNESGLIETVAVHTPRIDYLSGVGVILCEPTSTNTATYSNDFTQGDIFGGSGNPNANNSVITATSTTSPDGTNNGWKLTDNNDGGTGVAQMAYYSTNVTSGDSNTFSVFLKKGSTDFGILNTGGYDGTANGSTFFNLNTGALGNTSTSHKDVKMEDYGNGWYRCSISNRTTTDVQGSFVVGIATTNGTGSITRDGSNFLYMFGVQAEANDDTDVDSFLTSYIPTSGATVTRNKDEVKNGGNTDLINSTEGVFYLNLAGLYRKFKSTRRISLSDGGSGDNSIRFDFTSVEDKITMRIRVGGANVATKSLTGTVGDISQFRKYAIQWKENDFKFYADGTEVHSDTSGATYSANTLDRINFSTSAGGSHIEAKVKCIAVFKETLTDAELVTLTS